MSKFRVTLRIETVYEVNADSAAVAIRRAKNLLSMAHPKSKLTSVKVDKERAPAKDP